jgi:hypothetical protein
MQRQLLSNSLFLQDISSLRAQAPLYPKVIIRSTPYELNTNLTKYYVSTLVRLKKDSMWYITHVVESLIVENGKQVGIDSLFDKVNTIYNHMVVSDIHFPDGTPIFKVDQNQKD